MNRTFTLTLIGLTIILSSCNIENLGKIEICTEEAKICPDGHSVSRDPNNGCNFRSCD